MREFQSTSTTFKLANTFFREGKSSYLGVVCDDVARKTGEEVTERRCVKRAKQYPRGRAREGVEELNTLEMMSKAMEIDDGTGSGEEGEGEEDKAVREISERFNHVMYLAHTFCLFFQYSASFAKRWNPFRASWEASLESPLSWNDLLTRDRRGDSSEEVPSVERGSRRDRGRDESCGG